MFNLKTTQSQLSAGNNGMGDMHYVQYAPSRDVTGANFPNGAQHINWQCSGNKWWVPKRSYLRMRCRLTDGAGNQLQRTDHIAPAMGLIANLFQSIEFRVNNKTISRVSDYVSQVDMLSKRLNYSQGWISSAGEDLMMYNPDFRKRQSMVIDDGSDTPADTLLLNAIGLGANVAYGTPLTFLDLATPNQVQFANVGSQIIFSRNAGTVIPDLSESIRIGDYIYFNDGAAKVRKVTGFATTTTTNDTLVVDGAVTNQAAADLVAQVGVIPEQPKHGRRVKALEIIWQPPLSIFSLHHALPAGKYELVLNPQNVNAYKSLAIESLYGNKVPVTDFDFSVVDMYMYICMTSAIRMDNTAFYLDLKELSCQRRSVQPASGLQQEEFSVSPATSALAVAFQDNRVSSDTRFSPSKFKVGQPRDQELLLRRLYVQYAGMNKPQPDADPSYKVSDLEDYTSQRYADSIIYASTYFTSGGPESLVEWQDRGAYYYWKWPRDASDQSTRCLVNYQLSEAVTTGTILLFNEFRSVASIKIENGNSVMVEVREI